MTQLREKYRLRNYPVHPDKHCVHHTEYLEVVYHPLCFVIPPNALFVVSFDCFSSYTLVGKVKNIFLISMDTGCGDENPFFDTKPKLNLIEVGSRVLEEKFGESIKSA